MDYFDVLEEANFLSSAFDIDLYILESSPAHFHLISFDVLSFETVNSIQNWVSFAGDYVNGKDAPIDGGLPHNTLRLGAKGRKPKPHFRAVIYAKRERKLKSKRHFQAWKALTGLPEPPDELKNSFVCISGGMVSVYKTGIGAKPKPPKEDVFRIR